jgi:hypothetical protein
MQRSVQQRGNSETQPTEHKQPKERLQVSSCTIGILALASVLCRKREKHKHKVQLSASMHERDMFACMHTTLQKSITQNQTIHLTISVRSIGRRTRQVCISTAPKKSSTARGLLFVRPPTEERDWHDGGSASNLVLCLQQFRPFGLHHILSRKITKSAESQESGTQPRKAPAKKSEANGRNRKMRQFSLRGIGPVPW